MSDLDDKLREILQTWDRKGSNDFTEDLAVDRIKQVFADEGWSPLTEDGKVRIQELIRSRNLLTGKESYDKFKEEWGEAPIQDCCHPGADCSDQVRIDMQRGALEAAKKAAGIV